MYYQDHPELMQGGVPNMNDFAARSIAVQAEIARVTRLVTDSFDVQVGRQQRLIDRLRWLSPAVATHVALTDLAASNPQRGR